ncbi:MAG: hypothetical protein ABJ327_20660 [Litoreibacter sp.]
MMRVLLVLLTSTTIVSAEPVQFRYGLDILGRQQTTIDAFHSISAMRELRPGLFFGQTLYSAAAGDAGGLFVGGFELAKEVSLSGRTKLEFGGFLGGGGGAFVVDGDGLMSRFHVTLKQRISDNYAATFGLSYIDITGSAVSTPAFSFGITRDVDFALVKGHSRGAPAGGGRIVRAVKPLVKQFHPSGNKKRSGASLGTMTLLGFEASFASSPDAVTETFLQSTGAVAGDGEGYADIQAGYRWKTRPDGRRAFAEAAVGFGGGGDVDTGGGLIASAGIGAAIPIFPGFEAEIGANYTTALDGDLDAFSPYLRASLAFGNQRKEAQELGSPQRWQLSLGITTQVEHDGLRRAGSDKSGSPTLAETGLDLFLTERTYFTGNAQTVVTGDAGGYAVGLLGLGYAIPLNDTWTVSVEGYLGAAGGGGIDTGGGLMGGGRIELDYKLSDTLALSAGVGRLQSLRDGGARPVTLHLGFKTSFTTFH